MKSQALSGLWKRRDLILPLFFAPLCVSVCVCLYMCCMCVTLAPSCVVDFGRKTAAFIGRESLVEVGWECSGKLRAARGGIKIHHGVLRQHHSRFATLKCEIKQEAAFISPPLFSVWLFFSFLLHTHVHAQADTLRLPYEDVRLSLTNLTPVTL